MRAERLKAYAEKKSKSKSTCTCVFLGLCPGLTTPVSAVPLSPIQVTGSLVDLQVSHFVYIIITQAL